MAHGLPNAPERKRFAHAREMTIANAAGKTWQHSFKAEYLVIDFKS
jgi:hypothetical protein